MYKENTAKYLRLLLIYSIISLTLSVMRNVIHFSSWYTWVKEILSAGMAFCLFSLRKEHKCYRWAAIVMIIDLAATLLIRLVGTNSVMMLFYHTFGKQGYDILRAAMSVFNVVMLIAGIAAPILEYLGHSNLAKSKDSRFAKRWHYFFVGHFGIYVFTYALSYVFANMIESGTLTITMYEHIYPIFTLLNIGVRLIYMVYLYRTIQLISKREDDLFEQR